MSDYCDGVSSSSIVQLLLKFAHKEVHILLFHTSITEFPIMLLVKIFTYLIRKKEGKKKERKGKKLKSVLKIKAFLELFSVSLRLSADH